jgi:hypothetical protein
MSIIQGHSNVSAGGAFDTTLIERSAWFDGAADYVARQNGAAFANNQEAIFSFWVLRTKLDTQQAFFGSVEGGEGFLLQFENTNKLWIYQNNTYNQKTTAVYRDIGWYHILVSFDTSQATASDRVKLWVNGEQVTSFSTAAYNPQNTTILGLTGLMTGAETMHIGNYNNTDANYYYFNGYIAQACMLESISIQQGDYAVSDFLDTYTFGVNGSQYVPKADADIAALATAAGGNSFCLTTAIGDGTDASANGNDFTPNSMSDAANGSADTPSLVYANMDVLKNDGSNTSTIVFSEGNTRVTGSGGSDGGAFSTLPLPTSGTTEFQATFNNGYGIVGICCYDNLLAVSTSASRNVLGGLGVPYNAAYGYIENGNKYVMLSGGGTSSSQGAALTTNSVVTVRYDADSNEITFLKDNVVQGSVVSTVAGLTYYVFVSRYNNYDITLHFDSATFPYTIGSGNKTINTVDLTAPEFQGIDYFNPILYTGNGSTNAITGVGFQPDLVWIKNRTGSTSNSLYDAVRGVQKQLESDNTSAETTETTGLTAFGSDGFTVGSLAQVNTNTNNFVGWSWLAGGAGASNTDGSITSTVSKAAADHFSIVTYTGTGAAATVGHGLGGVPDLIIVKNRGTTGNWAVQSSKTSYATNVLYLDLTNASATAGVNVWNNTDPTSSVFSVGLAADTNASTNTYVAYCFKNVPGVCKIGLYKRKWISQWPVFLHRV